MVKYFLKVSFTLLFLFLLKHAAFGEIKLIAPYNGQFLEDRIIHFKWEKTNPEKEYVYRICKYTDETPFGISVCIPAKDGEIVWGLISGQIYYWKVQYRPLVSFNSRFDLESELFVFGLNKEITQSAWDLLEEYNREKQEPEKEEPLEEQEESEEEVEQMEEDVVEPPSVQEPAEKVEKKIPVPTRMDLRSNVIQESEFKWNIESGNVLGTSKRKENKEIVCKFKYFERSGSFEKVFCNIPRLEIEKELKYPLSDLWTVFLEGKVQREFNIQVDRYECEFGFLKPSTWFGCKEKLEDSETMLVKPHMFFRIYNGANHVPIGSFFLENDAFRLLARNVKNTNEMKLIHTYRIVNGKYNLFWDERLEYKIEPRHFDENNQGQKPFIFPFEQIIGVTQWYGNTAYQKPHTGIDFGATRERVLALADGVVVGKGWDSYYGECLSGGRYLKIKQSNGMHTVYFHLEDTYVNTGDFVKKGDVVARSGNSGAWNCQALAYHLHLETRLNASSSSHSNPVKYINVDWNRVPTLGWEKNPGRLTGENPHTGW